MLTLNRYSYENQINIMFLFFNYLSCLTHLFPMHPFSPFLCGKECIGNKWVKAVFDFKLKGYFQSTFYKKGTSIFGVFKEKGMFLIQHPEVKWAEKNPANVLTILNVHNILATNMQGWRHRRLSV